MTPTSVGRDRARDETFLEKLDTASPFLLKVVGLLPTPFFLLFSCAPGRYAVFTIPFRKDEKHSTENSEATIYTGAVEGPVLGRLYSRQNVSVYLNVKNV